MANGQSCRTPAGLSSMLEPLRLVALSPSSTYLPSMYVAAAARFVQCAFRGAGAIAFGLLFVSSTVLHAQVKSSEAIKPELIMEIGEDDAAFVAIAEVVAARDGRIYVLDVREPDIKVFTSSGKFMRSIGRSGAGPGEFTHPAHLQVGDRTLTITDWMQRRTSTFTLEGKHIQTRRYETPSTQGQPSLVRPVRGGSTVVAILPMVRTGARETIADLDSRLLFVPASEGPVDTLLQFRSEIALWRVRGSAIANVLTTGVGDGGAWALGGDSLLVTVDGRSGQVRWYVLNARAAVERRRAVLPGTPRYVAGVPDGVSTRW